MTRAPNPFDLDRSPLNLPPEYLSTLRNEITDELCGNDPPPPPPAAIDGPALRALLQAPGANMPAILEQQIRLDFQRLLHSRDGTAVTTPEQLAGAVNPFVDRVVAALYPGQNADQTAATRTFLTRWAQTQLIGREGNNVPAARLPQPYDARILNRLFADLARAMAELPRPAPPAADNREAWVRQLQQEGMPRLLRILNDRNTNPITTREQFNTFTRGLGTTVANALFPPAQRDTEAYRNLRDLVTQWAASTLYDVVPPGAQPAERPAALTAEQLGRLRALLEFPTDEANRRLAERAHGVGDPLNADQQAALRAARERRDAPPAAPMPRARPDRPPLTIQNPDTWRRQLADVTRRDGALQQLIRPFMDAATADILRDREDRNFDNLVARLTAAERPGQPNSFVTQMCHMLFPEDQRNTDAYRQFRGMLTDWVRWRVATQLPPRMRPATMPTQPNVGDMMALVPGR